MDNNDLHDREHLRRLERVFAGGGRPVYFVTLCSHERKSVLIVPSIAGSIVDLLGRCQSQYGWIVGKYVVMPDHLHFFCQDIAEKKTLSEFISGFKKWTTKAAWEAGHNGYLWQKEFFDHVLRDSESYAEKWDYIELNPVRAGLCKNVEDWKYMGECYPLR